MASNPTEVQYEGVVLMCSESTFVPLWKNVHLQVFRDSEIFWNDQSGSSNGCGRVLLKNVSQYFGVGNYTNNIPNRPSLPAGYSLDNLMAFPDYPSKEAKVNWILHSTKADFKQLMDAICVVLPPPPQHQQQPPQQQPQHQLQQPQQPHQQPQQPYAPPASYPRQAYPVQSAPVYPVQSQPGSTTVFYQSPSTACPVYYPAQQAAPGSHTVILRDGYNQGQGGLNNQTDAFATGLILGSAMGWGYGYGWGPCW